MDEEELKVVREAQKNYEEEISAAAQTWQWLRTSSGIPLKRLYTPANVEGTDYMRDLGFPGEFPFTRGAYSGGYLPDRAWARKQFIGVGTAEETNQRWRYLTSQGLNHLVIGGAGTINQNLDLWLDSDDERMLGWIGKTELHIDTLADFETLFEGIDLEKIDVTILSSNIVSLAMFIAVVEKRGINKKKLKGSAEIAKWGLGSGSEYNRENLDQIEYVVNNMPNFNHGCFGARNARDSGCTAPQEIAIALGMAIDVVNKLLERGLGVDEIAPGLGFFLQADSDFFEEIAKFRAIRRMWAKLMRERFGAKDPRSWRFRCHVQTAGAAMTRQQPLNNLIRGGFLGLAAVLGGAQSLHICSFDEAIASPSEFSAMMSLRTQQITQYETGVTKVIDPLGGSYYIEWLTDELENAAQKILNEMESKGGEMKSRRWLIEEVQKAALERLKQIESKERIIVGVNEFQMEEEAPIKVMDYDPAIAEKQIARLNRVRRERDNAKVEEAKEKLYNAFKSDDNIMLPTIQAVKSYLSYGEIQKVRIAAVGEEATKLGPWYCKLL